MSPKGLISMCAHFGYKGPMRSLATQHRSLPYVDLPRHRVERTEFMSKEPLSYARLLFAAATIAVAGCGGGGGGGGSSPSPAPAPPPPPPPSPSLQVLPPTSYDFGKVTAGNTAAPLQVTISNTGTAPLNVTGIALNSPSGGPYALAVGGGAKPCGATTRTIAAADSCTVQIVFQPTTNGTFNATLQVSSNAPNAPTASLAIAGSSEQVQTLSVRVNQVDTLACPGVLTTAYVSVNDQGGFPVLGLQLSAFSVTQGLGNTPLPLDSATFVGSVYKNVAIAGALDYSKSLRDQPVAFADMKTGFSNLFGNLKASDEGEVVKFATEYQVVQPFTPDRALLQAKVAEAFNQGDGTRLYDATYKAVEDAATKTNFRRAVIVATDGREELPASATPSVQNINTVIANAKSKNVPIFTLGSGTNINSADLSRMATDTGGIYYEASTSQNLATIYQQLASLLYENQYVLTFNRTVTGLSAVQSPIRITVSSGSGTLSGSATRDIVVCP